jgi:hypothetical protein
MLDLQCYITTLSMHTGRQICMRFVKKNFLVYLYKAWNIFEMHSGQMVWTWAVYLYGPGIFLFIIWQAFVLTNHAIWLAADEAGFSRIAHGQLVSYAACSRVRGFLPTYRLLTAATHSIPIAEEVGQQAAKHHGYWAPNSTRGFIDCWLSRSEHLSD